MYANSRTERIVAGRLFGIGILCRRRLGRRCRRGLGRERIVTICGRRFLRRSRLTSGSGRSSRRRRRGLCRIGTSAKRIVDVRARFLGAAGRWNSRGGRLGRVGCRAERVWRSGLLRVNSRSGRLGRLGAKRIGTGVGLGGRLLGRHLLSGRRRGRLQFWLRRFARRADIKWIVRNWWTSRLGRRNDIRRIRPGGRNVGLLLQEVSLVLHGLLVALGVLFLGLFKHGHPRFKAERFQLGSIAALDALQGPCDVVDAGGIDRDFRAWRPP